MSALIDILSDIINILTSYSVDIVNFITMFLNAIGNAFKENVLLGTLIVLLLIKIVSKIKSLIF